MEGFSRMIYEFDFTEVLMGAMLNFLLFAGAIHVNFSDLRQQRGPIIIFSTISVLISSLVIGGLLYYIVPLFGEQLSFIYCLLFGVLISPTDPIAVLGILKKANVPKSLETKITGESLFNDGVAVVLFAVLLQLAQTPGAEMSFGEISWLFLKEDGGTLLLGMLLGLGTSRPVGKVDEYNVTALITLSVVMGGYLVARYFHFSGPLTMVIAGLIIGNVGKKRNISPVTRDYLSKFWELLDEVLNAILFLFIGFELLIIPDILSHWYISIISIVLVLLARFASIYIPFYIVPFQRKFSNGTLSMLVWGALRGGVSIALVLQLEEGAEKALLLEMTYFVVVFSILVQGLTISPMAKRLLKEGN